MFQKIADCSNFFIIEMRMRKKNIYFIIIIHNMKLKKEYRLNGKVFDPI